MHHVKVCSGLATAAALRAVENEIPSSNDLVKKAEFDSNIAEIEKKKKKKKVLLLLAITNLQKIYLMQR